MPNHAKVETLAFFDLEAILLEVTDNTLSLYFGLHEGRKAELEVVSRAAIEWANSVRHAAQMVAPSADIRIEFIGAHESSLSLNTVLDWGEGQLEKISHPRLLAVAVGIALFLVIDAGPASEYWFGGPDQLNLNEEDRALLNDLMGEIAKSEELKKANRRFFHVVSNDSAISSVGICEAPRADPVLSVPSSQFGERSGLWEIEEVDNTRPSERISDVILETADLTDQDRKWRFRDIATGKPFTAKVRDQQFVKSLADGEVNENLRMGIKMQIHIKFTERFEDGEWKSLPSTMEVVKVSLG